MTEMMANTGRILEVTARTGDLYVIPAWGFLESIEVRFSPPLPNMNVAAPLRIIIEPLDGQERGQVYAHVRNVKEKA